MRLELGTAYWARSRVINDVCLSCVKEKKKTRSPFPQEPRHSPLLRRTVTLVIVVDVPAADRAVIPPDTVEAHRRLHAMYGGHGIA